MIDWQPLRWHLGDDWPKLPDTFLARIACQDKVYYTRVRQDEGQYFFDDDDLWGLEDITHWAHLNPPKGCIE